MKRIFDARIPRDEVLSGELPGVGGYKSFLTRRRQLVADRLNAVLGS